MLCQVFEIQNYRSTVCIPFKFIVTNHCVNPSLPNLEHPKYCLLRVMSSPREEHVPNYANYDCDSWYHTFINAKIRAKTLLRELTFYILFLSLICYVIYQTIYQIIVIFSQIEIELYVNFVLISILLYLFTSSSNTFTRNRQTLKRC